MGSLSEPARVQRGAASDLVAPTVRPAGPGHHRGAGEGRPLDPVTRAAAESRFGHDFSGVRVHRGPGAAASARAAGALAYTVGSDVVLDQERSSRRRGGVGAVLDHELGHAMEQRAGLVPAGTLQRLPDDGMEGDEGHRRGAGERGRIGGTPSYREGVEAAERYRVFTPTAAQVSDDRPAVLPADKATLDRIVAFVADADQKIRSLLASKEKRPSWVTEQNANIQAVLSLMGQLLGDLRSGGIIVRFDQPAGRAAASYDFGENLMHVRRVATANDISMTVPDMLHEYAHAIQDRTAAAALAAGGRAREHTREAELQQEIGARLYDVYGAQLLSQVGLGPKDFDLALHQIYATVHFHTEFERARTGSAAQRKAATRSLRDKIEKAYTDEGQLDRNAPAGEYPIELTMSNTAILTVPGPGGRRQEVDLGAVPAAVKTRDALVAHLQARLSASPWFASLFTGPRGTAYKVAMFTVFHRLVEGGERVVTGFVMGPPAAPNPPVGLPPPAHVHIPP